MNDFIVAYLCFIEQCYKGGLYAEYDVKVISWFLKEKRFRATKVTTMLMILNGELLSQQNLFAFFPE